MFSDTTAQPLSEGYLRQFAAGTVERISNICGIPEKAAELQSCGICVLAVADGGFQSFC